MQKEWKKFVGAFLMVLALAIAGCGGGGGSTSGGANGNQGTHLITGVAATGDPLSGTVYLKDSASPSVELSAPINADGSFSFDATGLTGPFLLKAKGTAGGQNYTLYSFAGTTGIANINPLSHLAVMQANGGADPAALYAAPTPAQMEAVKAALSAAISQIQTLLQPILSNYGVATANFISEKYTANHSGLDLLFDMIEIAILNGNLTITNKVTAAIILTTVVNGNTLNGQITTANIPSVPTLAIGSVYVYPMSSSVAAGGAVNFKAIVIGATDQSVTWSVTEVGGGTISSSGVYTAPMTTGTFHIKATSATDNTKSGTATVEVKASTDGSASAPYIVANIASLAGGAIPDGGWLQKVRVYTDSTTLTPITTATVIVNGTTLPYVTSQGMYLGNMSIAPGTVVTLNVTLGSNTYTASGTQYSTLPSITAPTSGAVWHASNANTVSWTSGAPTSASEYYLEIMGDPNWNGISVPVSSTSYTIPPNSLTAGYEGQMLLIIQPTGSTIGDRGIPVANAAAGSVLAIGGIAALVPITVQ